LLFRSGFNVDIITNNQLLKKFISNCELVLDSKLIPIQAAKRNLDKYDCIITCDFKTNKKQPEQFNKANFTKEGRYFENEGLFWLRKGSNTPL
jgi:hypothetical protein